MIQGSLLVDTNNYAECQMLDAVTVNDGYGGVITTRVLGATFDAAFSNDQSVESKVASAQGVRDVYSVYTDSSVVLLGGMVFRRLKDGKTFRVTSDGDDKQTPTSSPLNMRKVTAEEWSLPNDEATGA